MLILIEQWFEKYRMTLFILVLISFIIYLTYRVIYIRKINRILKKEEKPKKLLPIEYFSIITLIFTFVSLFIVIGVDKYIHRDININMSTSLLDLNIKNIYEQLDEYSKKDMKIKVEDAYSFRFRVDNNYRIINKGGKSGEIDEIEVLIPRLNKYSKYRCSELGKSVITFSCKEEIHMPNNLNYWMDVEDFYSKIDVANELIKKVCKEDIKKGSYYSTIHILFRKAKKQVEFNNITIVDENGKNKEEKYTYKGKYLTVFILPHYENIDDFGEDYYIF